MSSNNFQGKRPLSKKSEIKLICIEQVNMFLRNSLVERKEDFQN